jgi:hypothetical protein
MSKSDVGYFVRLLLESIEKTKLLSYLMSRFAALKLVNRPVIEIGPDNRRDKLRLKIVAKMLSAL